MKEKKNFRTMNCDGCQCDDCYEWWRLRHWDYARKEQEEEAEKRIEPRSAWLFNAREKSIVY